MAARVASDATAPVFPTVLIRRSAVEGVGGHDESMTVGEDTDLHWRLREAGMRIGARDEPVIVRRVFGVNPSYERIDRRDDLFEITRRSLAGRLAPGPTVGREPDPAPPRGGVGVPPGRGARDVSALGWSC